MGWVPYPEEWFLGGHWRPLDGSVATAVLDVERGLADPDEVLRQAQGPLVGAWPVGGQPPVRRLRGRCYKPRGHGAKFICVFVCV